MGTVVIFLVGVFIGLILNSLLQVFLPSQKRHPYSNPNIFFPIKATIFYILMKLRKRQTKRSKKSAGYGVSSYEDESLMDKPQKLDDNMKAIDAVFFSGSCKSGWGVVLAMERRPKGLSSVVVYLKTLENAVLVPFKHPDCIYFRSEEDEGVFKAGGLTINVCEPLKKWHLQYEGKLRKVHDCNDTSTFDNVSIDLEFISSLPIFNYDSDLDPWSMAKTFAREPWTRSFFHNLRSHHQTHIEQMGKLVGDITINNKKQELSMQAFRDHSYSHKRDWSLMHRYYFHHIFLEDGSMGVLGLVCQPSTCTRLVLGHWWNAKEEGRVVTEIDLELEEHGEGGTPPSDYSFTFRTGEEIKEIKVKFVAPSVHYLGWDWEAKFYEVFVNYEVDGVPGSGICEWEYRHTLGRPKHVNDTDPEWTKLLRVKYLTT